MFINQILTIQRVSVFSFLFNDGTIIYYECIFQVIRLTEQNKGIYKNVDRTIDLTSSFEQDIVKLMKESIDLKNVAYVLLGEAEDNVDVSTINLTNIITWLQNATIEFKMYFLFIKYISTQECR